MARQIALLRGVNVGGKKRVEMAKLRSVVEELGYTDVRTYVNSGNVVYTGPKRSAKHVERALAEAFGFAVPVVLRTRDELAAVVEANPLREGATEPAKHAAVFGAEKPGVTPDPQEFEPEPFVGRGREAFLSLPNGIPG